MGTLPMVSREERGSGCAKYYNREWIIIEVQKQILCIIQEDMYMRIKKN